MTPLALAEEPAPYEAALRGRGARRRSQAGRRRSDRALRRGLATAPETPPSSLQPPACSPIPDTKGGATPSSLQPPFSSLTPETTGAATPSSLQPPASSLAPDTTGGATPSSLQLPASGVPPAARAAGEHLTEAQLSAIWQGRRFPAAALVTRAGVPVTVVYQGRAGRGPGPDFRGAVIAGPSGLTLRGDVELHVRSSSFRAHGHAGDPAYADVVLHVVFEDDTGVDTPLFGGGTAAVVALAPWVARRAGELQRWLERPLLWREPCHEAVTRMGAEAAAAALDAEGERRFAGHVARYEEAVKAVGLDQALYEGLLAALGYGGNEAAMRSLARLVPWRRLDDAASDHSGAQRPEPIGPEGSFAPDGAPQTRADVLCALLAGGAGLLPSQRGHRRGLDPYVAGLERTFAASGLPALPAGTWKLWGVRPGNAPARRIAAAAALLAPLSEPATLLRCAAAESVNDAIAPLRTTAAGYWRTHHDPCAGGCRLPPALVGRSRALEIMLNVVLPAAVASGDRLLAGGARDLYARLPRPAAYGVTRFLEHALASGGERIPLNARRGQALLALHRDWCTQGGCGRCPLSSGMAVEGETRAREDSAGG